MIRKLSFATMVVFGCTAAHAADSRIRSTVYDPDHIVQILGRPGIQSTIEFGDDERIENVAVGDSSKWQITPNRRASLLFVKPLVPRSRTNMTVVTDRRTYMFDLVAGDKWTTPVYALKFSYPYEKPVAGSPPAPSPQPVLVAVTQQDVTTTAEKLHFDWQSRGERRLIPSRVFDDGRSIYLSWSKETPLPAILTMGEDRKEGPLSYQMKGDYIVVSPIPQNLVLRYGSRTAQLWTTRRIVQQPQPTAPTATPPSQIAQRMAATPPQSAQPSADGNNVKLANMTALFSDTVTDGRE